VADRVNELASWDAPRHPQHRPPYMHVLPLAEVICLARGVSNPQAKKVQDEWMRLVRALGSEINVLVDAPIEDVKRIDAGIGGLVAKFREGSVPYVAGGGGQYGRPTLKGEKDAYWGRGQKKLDEF